MLTDRQNFTPPKQTVDLPDEKARILNFPQNGHHEDEVETFAFTSNRLVGVARVDLTFCRPADSIF